MRKNLIVLYLMLLSFKVYGYPYNGYGGDNNYASTANINPTLAASIVIGFFVFVAYVTFRVWLGLKKDKHVENDDK
jgi:hypothetical protein